MEKLYKSYRRDLFCAKHTSEMNDKQLKEIELKLKFECDRIETNIGNLGEEVAIYVKYKAGGKAYYDNLPVYFHGCRIVKDGLFNKIKR